MDLTDKKAFEMMEAAADATAVQIDAVKPPDKEYGLEGLHLTLAGTGFFPMPVGTVADVADALLYLVEGKGKDATIAGLSALPAGSLMFRGIGAGSWLHKTFRKGMDFISSTDAKKLIGEVEGFTYAGFKESALKEYTLVGKKGTAGLWGESKDLLHATTAAAEAGATYGPKILRIEVKPSILKFMEETNHLLTVPSAGGRGLQTARHMLFRHGINLRGIKDLRLFQDFDEYLQYMLDAGHIKDFEIHKWQQKYLDYIPKIVD